jgi:uncharacterized protein YbbC (DUF1343 family)
MKHATFFILLSWSTALLPLTLGVENIIADQLQELTHKKVGLILNQTSVTSSGVSTLDFLVCKGIRPVVLMSPEHGIDGLHAMEELVADHHHKKLNISVVSLYNRGSHRKDVARYFKQCDVIIFDMQDSGMRHYTYISTMIHAMSLAAHYNKDFVVLDRPNPLGGIIEGPLVDPLHHSFISSMCVPVRHGMTIGELARFANQTMFHDNVQLHVVPMSGYTRTEALPTTMQFNLSPNIQTKQSCWCYSFSGLLSEVRPFDTGVGTLSSFQYILLPESVGLPKKVWWLLDDRLKRLGISSVWHRQYSERKKQWCSGLKVCIGDINNVSAFNVLLTVLTVMEKNGVKLTFSPAFDRAVGTSLVRERIQKHVTHTKMTAKINKELNSFYQKAHASFLYSPISRVVNIA